MKGNFVPVSEELPGVMGVYCALDEPVTDSVVAEVDVDGVGGIETVSDGRTILITSCQSGFIVFAVLGGVEDGSESKSSSASDPSPGTVITGSEGGATLGGAGIGP